MLLVRCESGGLFFWNNTQDHRDELVPAHLAAERQELNDSIRLKLMVSGGEMGRDEFVSRLTVPHEVIARLDRAQSQCERETHRDLAP